MSLGPDVVCSALPDICLIAQPVREARGRRKECTAVLFGEKGAKGIYVSYRSVERDGGGGAFGPFSWITV